MKCLLISLFLIFICGSCEPYGGEIGELYLGRVQSLRYVDIDYFIFTEIKVKGQIISVEGRVDIPGIHDAYVWMDIDRTYLSFRGLSNIKAKHKILDRTD